MHPTFVTFDIIIIITVPSNTLHGTDKQKTTLLSIDSIIPATTVVWRVMGVG
jgi:hypothetical protein